MQPMNAINVNPGFAAGPGDFILPIKYCYESASSEPVLVAWWQWVPPQSGTSQGYWAMVEATA